VFLTAFLLGLLGSLHCIGMCGAIAFMLPVDHSNAFKKVLQIGSYHFGRLFAYSLIGLVFGVLGKGFYLFGLQQHLSIAIGILMIAIVLFPSTFTAHFSIAKPIYKAVSNVKSAMGAAFKKKTADTFLTIGFLNGFLPCGLVYIAVFGAIASGGLMQGSLYMFLFGLGTVPLMTTAIYFSTIIKQNTREKLRKAIPVFVIIIGLLFIIRGLGLGIPFLSPKPVVELVSSNMDCHS
jgi:hypothetical protein